MIAISFKFLAGRYHATPWGRHVNEGAVEWPPSPWRILRALVATWKRTLPELPQEQVEPILCALAEPPEFVLPPASTGHTRHFMPWDKNWKPNEPDKAKTKVFDTFVAVSRETPLWVQWSNVLLDEMHREVLADLLRNLNFLGRSESWCEAELATGTGDYNCRVCRPLQDEVPRDHEIVRLLSPHPTSAFANDMFTRKIRRKRGGNIVEESVKTATYEPDWHLCAETLWLHDQKWSDPPGSQWVRYVRPSDCFKIEPKVQPRLTVDRSRMQIVRYALDSTVLPLVTETLSVAEAARRALMGIYGRLTESNAIRGRSKVLSGKDEHGQPLTDHRHAYYLPTDEDGDGRLDHLTVYAAESFGPDERRAFDRLHELRMSQEGEVRHPLRLLLLSMGTCDDFARGPLQASKVWVSATPYLATQYAKTRGRRRIDLRSPEARAKFLIDDLCIQLHLVRSDIMREGVPDVMIESLWDSNHVFKIAGQWRPLQFKRFRHKASDDGGQRLAGAFRLTFREHVRGPIALGWSSHFGLGLFVPAENTDEK